MFDNTIFCVSEVLFSTLMIKNYRLGAVFNKVPFGPYLSICLCHCREVVISHHPFPRVKSGPLVYYYSFLHLLQMNLIRKINAITAKVFGVNLSTKNVENSRYTENDSRSKIDVNNIIKVEYIKTKVQIIFNKITNIFFDILI